MAEEGGLARPRIPQEHHAPPGEQGVQGGEGRHLLRLVPVGLLLLGRLALVRGHGALGGGVQPHIDLIQIHGLAPAGGVAGLDVHPAQGQLAGRAHHHAPVDGQGLAVVRGPGAGVDVAVDAAGHGHAPFPGSRAARLGDGSAATLLGGDPCRRNGSHGCLIRCLIQDAHFVGLF